MKGVIMNFNYYQPTKIFFKQDEIFNLNSLIKEYGKKILIVGPHINESIKPMFEKIVNLLKKENFEYITFFEVESNPSTKTVSFVIKLINEFKPSVILAVGGGSVIDTSKIASVVYNLKNLNWSELFDKYDDFTVDYPKITNKKLPVIAVPTTSGTGSQCTHACVITDKNGMKRTIFHHQIFVEKTILDPNLTTTLPPSITQATAFDAFSHCLESYLRSDHAICNVLALEGIKKIFTNLPKVLEENNVKYRENLMIADTLGGISLTNCGAMLPHPLSEIIGSFIKISHGDALALVYPAFVKHTLNKYKYKYANIAAYLNCNLSNININDQTTYFYNALLSLIGKCNLNHKITDYEKDLDKINYIKKFIIELKLPMEDDKTIKSIVEEIFN